MSLTLGFAVYVVLWWLTLFMILPWGVSQVNPDDLLPGEDPGAPAKPQIVKKFIITTGVSLVFFAIFYLVYESGVISFRE